MKPDDNKYKDDRRRAAQVKSHAASGSSPSGSGSNSHKNSHGSGSRGNSSSSSSTAGGASVSDRQTEQGRRPASATKQMDDEEAEAAAAERRKYQARPKTSNWEKYDKTKMEMLLDDRLNLDLVGADYTSLLQAQAAVMLPEEAYFRFKDEQVAENQPTPADFDADAIALLSVNSHAVASALATLPLHVQLNIDSRYFERALLDDFELEAQSNLTKWNEAHPAPVPPAQAAAVVSIAPTHSANPIRTAPTEAGPVQKPEIAQPATLAPPSSIAAVVPKPAESELDELLALDSGPPSIKPAVIPTASVAGFGISSAGSFIPAVPAVVAPTSSGGRTADDDFLDELLGA